VHRLLHCIGLGPVPSIRGSEPNPSVGDVHDLRDVALRLLPVDEVDAPNDAASLVDAAVDAYRSICAREDVRALYQSGRALHEVPFTMSMDGRIVRGTIDCLVETGPGAFTLLEFKTGRERPEDRQQVQLYLQALRQVFSGAVIEARVVYTAGGSVATV
jgi:ATP-dependent exoDNAse (exonuclease V) beta subunit